MFTHRRRPFLIKSLENTLSKLLKSLDFYDNAARHKVAIGTSNVAADRMLRTGLSYLTVTAF